MSPTAAIGQQRTVATVSFEVAALTMKFVQINARLVCEIPDERVTLGRGRTARMPLVGDLVFADQGFAGPDGTDMFLTYCQLPDGSTPWSADVYEAELEWVSP